MSRAGGSFGSVVKAALAGARNAQKLLPGERPEWVIVELSGTVVARAERPRFMGLPIPSPDGVHSIALDDLVASLEALGGAPWLTGVVFLFQGFAADPAIAYALRRAIAALGASGKRTTAYLEHLDATSYYVASAASEVVAPESAEIALHGMGVSITFVGEALAKLGVRFEKLAIDEYKNAFDNLARSEMTPAHREQLEVLLERIEAHHHEMIGKSRRLGAAELRGLIDEGVSSAARAKAAGLIDRIDYEDAVVTPKHAALAEAKRFLGVRVPPISGGRVGIVRITGGIMSGKSRRVPGLFGAVAGSDTIIRALRTAADDESTAAVVLYVDSPGGSALASDVIGREVKRLRDKKPVVALMGAVAASGGYYVLTHANHVIAAPTTITGSIGVLTGKLALDELFARWGLRAEQVKRGRYALMLDPAKSLTEEERALLRRSNEEVYERFVARVAEGRRLTPERVKELARGRIWAGTDALANGLVDELGDLTTAVAHAKNLGGLGATAPTWTIEAPRDRWLASALAAQAMTAPTLGLPPRAVLDALRALTRETSWLVFPAWLRWE